MDSELPEETPKMTEIAGTEYIILIQTVRFPPIWQITEGTKIRFA